jgi:hypothetical protein
MIGAILAVIGGFGLYSDITHQMTGRPTTATLLEHIHECTVEYQRIGEERRKEKWPCDLAEEFQRRVGTAKVKLSHEYIARVEFPLADGRRHVVNVDESKLGSSKLAIGATLPVVYAPNKPDDVRAPMSWERFRISLGILAVGVVFFALALGNPFAGLFAWAFRGRTSGRGEEIESASFEHLAASMAARAFEPKESSTSQRRLDTPATANTFSPATGSAPRASFGLRNR